MKKYFSTSSDVTLVITSCGRFDLLKKTIDSFLEYNTYPIRKIIITEDSGSDEVYTCLPDGYNDFFDVMVNNPKLGQMKSIDLAYSKVKTQYIFHCEDDWEFYRSGFIEDSIGVLESNDNILQVWLRSYYHDVKVNCDFHTLGDAGEVNGVLFNRLLSSKPDWQGFSFNPGLRRLKDYQGIVSYSSFDSEKNISRHYRDSGMYAVILQNDAVAHLGYGHHVVDVREDKKKRKKRTQDVAIIMTSFILGLAFGAFFI